MASIDLLTRASEVIQRASSSSDSYFAEALNEALNTLEINNIVAPDGIEKNFIDGSSEQYYKFFSELTERFSELFSDINKTRSSYLPYELVKDSLTTDGEQVSFEETSSAEALLESYENTFFRMLGMPSSSDIPDDARLVALNKLGRLLLPDEQPDKAEYNKYYLDARQLNIDERPLVPSAQFYDFLASLDPLVELRTLGFTQLEGLIAILDILKRIALLDSLKTEKAASLSAELQLNVGKYDFDYNLLDEDGKRQFLERNEIIIDFLTLFTPEELVREVEEAEFREKIFLTLDSLLFILEPTVYFSIQEDTKVNIEKKYIYTEETDNLGEIYKPSNFWKFSYYMFPPIQDGRISKCISEPGKIVAEPFLPDAKRKINGKILRSSLLEAVIRIRLDIITGAYPESVDDFSQPNYSFGGSQKGITYNDIKENYGILESLLIVRLFDSIVGMSLDIKEKAKEIQKQQYLTGYVPSALKRGQQGGDSSGGSAKDGGTEEANPEIKKLQAIKAVDDSISLLLGSNKQNSALDLQEGIARDSTVIDAHLMGSVLAAVNIPSKWADGKIASIKGSSLDNTRGPSDVARSSVDIKLGRSKGVGMIDVIVFVTALFTVPEFVLISLLNDKQFDYLKEEFPAGFFDNYEDRITIEAAVNYVGNTAFDIYELFRLILSEEDIESLFVY